MSLHDDGSFNKLDSYPNYFVSEEDITNGNYGTPIREVFYGPLTNSYGYLCNILTCLFCTQFLRSNY